MSFPSSKAGLYNDVDVISNLKNKEEFQWNEKLIEELLLCKEQARELLPSNYCWYNYDHEFAFLLKDLFEARGHTSRLSAEYLHSMAIYFTDKKTISKQDLVSSEDLGFSGLEEIPDLNEIGEFDFDNSMDQDVLYATLGLCAMYDDGCSFPEDSPQHELFKCISRNTENLEHYNGFSGNRNEIRDNSKTVAAKSFCTEKIFQDENTSVVMDTISESERTNFTLPDSPQTYSQIHTPTEPQNNIIVLNNNNLADDENHANLTNRKYDTDTDNIYLSNDNDLEIMEEEIMNEENNSLLPVPWNEVLDEPRRYLLIKSSSVTKSHKSCLALRWVDWAFLILCRENKPLGIAELTQICINEQLFYSTATRRRPDSSLAEKITREIKTKGNRSRFSLLCNNRCVVSIYARKILQKYQHN
jgi:hypothetical protein